MTCNRHFAQNMPDHLSACRLHFSTFKVPETVILTLHHGLQTDYNFQDLGYDVVFLLQKPSASPAWNDYLSVKLDCENPKRTVSGSVALNL